mmetsp:Transcript_4975/g.9780  ORF Transcript_4975/g.9780 Transcript_4975/m.9780 type:complete len:100 (-) Transcript_4975:69-368(-)|eukprot:CAMPEP_0173406188 /NCGR_PEP_ID=MMETSP1356-20130122/63915_1 /TAXON_ID=77927 ORGANISM="Hemiselmis virescens, Strain PCC157" /NCGR_SAMPLE_ID=MMETSP1356 /ASSEMBLY_ACC=CAM_ASM_000847 /LENGTH=99 /DNA_ID=CAMNT_0014367125 /DNA_START=153 /DNA_END=452 /DNA_ORIENTATION=-
MEDDASFLGGTYTVHLTRSMGLGQGVMGYGMQFEPRPVGPTVTKVFPGGEAFRTGLIQPGDILVEVNNSTIREIPFMAVMDSIVATQTCSFTFASGPVR